MSDRHDLLLALARADGQPWASIAEATEHTAEMMYGKQADAVEQLLDRWKTLALRLRGDGAAVARIEALADWCEREEAQLVVWYGHQQCVSQNAAMKIRDVLAGRA